MFNPAEALRENPALFACYILYVYFRGQNVCRIEREMRALGFTTFHRRNLYPRGRQPGWIAKHNWHTLFKQDVQDRQDARGGNTSSSECAPRPLAAYVKTEPLDHQDSHPVHPVHPVKDPTQTTESHDFHSWLKRVAPNMTWDWKHQEVIIKQLEKVTIGECKRLMIFLPPRHGKTELVSVKYTAWRMQRDPSMNVILGSYNQRLADRMSRKIRTTLCDSEAIRLGRTPQYRSVPPAVTGGVFSAHGSFKQDAQDRQDGERGTNNDHPVHPVHPVPIPSDQGSPFPFSRPRPKNAVSEWETAAGGSFRAIGSGSGVTGFGANLIVIDDPVKNRAQAESETYRNRVWDWYKDDLYTRLEPDGSIVLIQTRWHEDDLAGRLLRDNLDDWTVINLPALSEPSQSTSVPPAVAGGDVSADPSFKQDAQDIQDVEGGNTSSSECAPQSQTTNMKTKPLDDQEQHPAHPVHPVRSPAEVTNTFDWREAPDIALCPERFPVEALLEQKRQLGTYSFSALYQQRPTPAGGQIFKREWFKQIIDFAPPGLKWKRGYDLAVSTSTESDYTASFRVAFDDKTGNLYISGGFRRRMEFPDQRRYIIDRIKTERDTEHGIEAALHGQALIQDLRRDPAIRGKSLSGVKVSTDKLTRALTWSPIAEDGKVIFVRDSSHTESPRRQHSFRQDAQDIQDGLSDTEISPRIKNHPAHPVHPVRISPQPTHSDWISDLLDELAAFPNGTHDDQIDAISIAVQMASKRSFRSGGALIK